MLTKTSVTALLAAGGRYQALWDSGRTAVAVGEVNR